MSNAFESSETIAQHFPGMNVGDLVYGDVGESNSGKSGQSVRMRERTQKPELSDLERRTFMLEFTGDQLYNAPETVPTIDSRILFDDDDPLTWDFGCGRGERIVDLAKANPNKKFVGVDKHYTSLAIGVRAVVDSMLDNVRFVKAPCESLIRYMPVASSAAAAVMFPAPIPKKKGFLGMPSPEFATQVHRILMAQGSPFEFATDSEPYFNYRMRQIGKLGLYCCSTDELKVGINNSSSPTRYQRIWESKGIPSFSATMRKA